MKEKLHFAHGNGFPSPCYRQMLSGLSRHYDCYFIDRIGHSPTHPVTENWHLLVDELIAHVKSQTSEPIIGVGHSLGGVLSFLAAIQEPQLFKKLILLDSPIINRFKSNVIRLSKRLGFIDRITPALRTRARREHWKNREEALHYLKSRDLFKSFTDACLNDYIDYGLEKKSDGYHLRFNRHIEYQIYRTIPHVLHEYEGKLALPTSIIYGERSDIIDKGDLQYMKKYHKIKSYGIAGSHMFPFECPEKASALIIQALGDLNT